MNATKKLPSRGVSEQLHLEFKPRRRHLPKKPQNPLFSSKKDRTSRRSFIAQAMDQQEQRAMVTAAPINKPSTSPAHSTKVRTSVKKQSIISPTKPVSPPTKQQSSLLRRRVVKPDSPPTTHKKNSKQLQQPQRPKRRSISRSKSPHKAYILGHDEDDSGGSSSGESSSSGEEDEEDILGETIDDDGDLEQYMDYPSTTTTTTRGRSNHRDNEEEDEESSSSDDASDDDENNEGSSSRGGRRQSLFQRFRSQSPTSNRHRVANNNNRGTAAKSLSPGNGIEASRRGSSITRMFTTRRGSAAATAYPENSLDAIQSEHGPRRRRSTSRDQATTSPSQQQSSTFRRRRSTSHDKTSSLDLTCQSEHGGPPSRRMARRNSHDGSVLQRLSGSLEDLRHKVMDPLNGGSSHNPRTTKWAGRKPRPPQPYNNDSDSDSDSDESSFGNPNWEEDRQLSKEETMYWEEMAKEIEKLDI